MDTDILAKVRKEILDEDIKLLPWVPKSLDNTWEVQAGIAGAITGALAGLNIGMHLGIAGGFGAIAGTIPCAIIGGIIGYLTGAKVGTKFQRNEIRCITNDNTPKLINSEKPSVNQLPDSLHCHNCGALYSEYWDVHQDRCGKCYWKG